MDGRFFPMVPLLNIAGDRIIEERYCRTRTWIGLNYSKWKPTKIFLFVCRKNDEAIPSACTEIHSCKSVCITFNGMTGYLALKLYRYGALCAFPEYFFSCRFNKSVASIFLWKVVLRSLVPRMASYTCCNSFMVNF